MSRPAQTLRELARVRADNHALLRERWPWTALGRKNFTPEGLPTGEPCIIVYVPRKQPNAVLRAAERIPPVLRSQDDSLHAWTDVVETDGQQLDVPPPDALSPDNERLCAALRWEGDPALWGPLRPGVRLGYGSGSGDAIRPFSGSMTGVVRTRQGGLRGLLTNQHIGREPGLSLFRPVYRPGAERVAMVRQVLGLLADEQWLSGVDEPDAFAIVDASFAPLREGVAAENRLPDGRPLGPVAPLREDSLDLIGARVAKLGQRTGTQHGIVLAVGASRPGYDGGLDGQVGLAPARFYTDMVIGPRAPSTFVSAPGDSGALVYLDEPEDALAPRPLGLLWGGAASDLGRQRGLERVSFAASLDRVLRALDLTLEPSPRSP